MAFSAEKEKVVQAFIYHYTTHSQKENLAFIAEWYKNKNLDLAMDFYRKAEACTAVLDEFEKQTHWLSFNQITATPTILFNGYRYPKTYDISDLKYLNT